MVAKVVGLGSDAPVKLKEVWSLVDVFRWLQGNLFVQLLSSVKYKAIKVLGKQFIHRNYKPQWKSWQQRSATVRGNKDTGKAVEYLKFKCDGCKRKFKTKRGLNQHEVSCKDNATESEPSTSHSDLQISLTTDREMNRNYVNRESLANLYDDYRTSKNILETFLMVQKLVKEQIKRRTARTWKLICAW